MKREFFASILFFALFQFIGFSQDLILELILSFIGFLALIVWIIATMVYYSKKSVSKYSDVMLRLEIRERWYNQIFVPILLYISITFIAIFVQIEIIKQFIFILSTISFFLLFYFTKISYQKVFSIEKNTRLVIDLISTILFFAFGLSLTISGQFQLIYISLFLGIYTSLAFIGSSYNANIFSINSVLWAFLSGISIFIFGLFFQNLTMLLFPIVMTMFFYLLLSFWHLKIMGEHSLEKYLTPVIFIIMSLLIILS